MVSPLEPETESLINSALLKAVQASGPVKLYQGKFGNDGLFAQRKGIYRKAADHGFGTEPPLWSEEPRTSMHHTLFVRLERGGLERLITITKPNARRKLITSASELYRRELLERWSDLAVAHQWEADFQKIADCCASLISCFQKLVPNGRSQGGSEPLNGGVKGTSDSSEVADFKRRMAHELVIAWKYAPTAEAKQSIANALKNSGIQQIGVPNAQLIMDGGLHRCDGPAFPGDKVEVIESGWLVHDGVGEFLLEKAIVKLI